MSKILYIEDELSSTHILNLFDKYLSKEEKKIFENQKKRKLEIKEILDSNPFVNVEFNFVDAIERIENHYDEYSYFIVDRNLIKDEQFPAYDISNVKKPIEAKIEQKSEGDYLFLVLLDKYIKFSNPRFLLENFYFLTAFPPETEKIKNSLEKLFLFFKPDHIIEKSDKKMENNFIQNKINKFKDLTIKSKHREVFEVFSKGYLDHSYEKNLLSIMKEIEIQNQTQIKKNICMLRQIFEAGILEKVVTILRDITNMEKIKDQIPNDYWEKAKYKRYILDLLSPDYNSNLETPKLLTFLNGTTEITYPYKKHTESHFTNLNYLLTDSYFRIISDKFWKASSEVVHGQKVTTYTLQILINILLDFLIWFKRWMDKK